ncbi:MAG: hypothetical protein ABJG41_14040 [Cyclobacteriaceae bacterium]
MILLNRIPFSDKLIQTGLHDVDVWLCSTGGAGSNLLKHFLEQHVKVKSPYSAALLTHHKEPVDCDKLNYKAIYLHADPFSILKSVKRRGLVKTNIKKLNNQINLGDSDILLLESLFNQFEKWSTAKVSYPVLCIKYEALYDSLDQIGEFLSIPMDNFPPKKERLSSDIEVEDRLYNQFRSSYEKWKSYPDLVVIEPHK